MHRWPGSKRRILSQLFDVLPTAQADGTPFRRWVEPFYGSGAVAAQAIDRGVARRYLLGDASGDLVACHLAARDGADQLIADVRALRDAVPDTREGYELARDGRVAGTTRAARFLYVIAAGFNGLWRVNATGKVNVTKGSGLRRFFVDVDAIRAQGERLRRPGVSLLRADFGALLRTAGAGDVVYTDPPYVDNFAGYVPGGFDRRQHLRLAALLRAAARRGARCYVSNSATPTARAIYGGRVHVLSAHRSISRDGNDRGAVDEILVEVEP